MISRAVVHTAFYWLNRNEDLGYRPDEIDRFTDEYLSVQGIEPEKPFAIDAIFFDDEEEPDPHEIILWDGPDRGVHERYICSCGVSFSYQPGALEHVKIMNKGI